MFSEKTPYVKLKYIFFNLITHMTSAAPVYRPIHSSDQTLLLEYELYGVLICLFHLPLLVYEAIMKESGLNDLESKHLAKRAKHSHNDTG